MPERIAPDCLRLRLATASICGTDMHYFRHFENAGMRLESPVTLGHEACAHVEDPNGHPFSSGDLVAINPVIECGDCSSCRSGDVNMCATKRFPGSATTRPHIDGFFRELFDFPARCCHRVRKDISPDHLTFAEPLACAMHAVARADVRRGQLVLVTGCGPMGLLATAAANARGAEVHVTDLKPAAIDAAISVGAKTGFSAEGDSSGPGANTYDVVIEASGSAGGFNDALDAVRKQGTVAVLSLIQPTPTPIDLHLVALKEVIMTGSILFTSEFPEAVETISRNAIDFEAITAARFPISDAQAACMTMASNLAVGKILIKPA